jgi:hypothetical protein
MVEEKPCVLLRRVYDKQGRLTYPAGTLFALAGGGPHMALESRDVDGSGFTAVVRDAKEKTRAMDAILLTYATPKMWRVDGARLVNILDPTKVMDAIPDGVERAWYDEVIVKKGKKWGRLVDHSDEVMPVATAFIADSL